MNREKLRAAAPHFLKFGIVCLGVSLTALFFYPGILNKDSEWQFHQARQHVYQNWHPVCMAYLWHYVNKIIPGSGGMLILHLTLFWTGLTLFSWNLFQRQWLRVVFPFFVGFYFPLLLGLAQVIKDAAFVGGTMLACGALMASHRRTSNLRALLIVAGLLYAQSVRHNAVFALYPLSVWFIALYAPRYRRSVALVAMALSLSLMLVVKIFEKVVIRPTSHYIEQTTMILDLAAISLAENVYYLPNFYSRPGRPPFTLDLLRKVYSDTDAAPLLWGGWAGNNARTLGFVHPETDREIKVLRATWIGVVLTRPVTYLKHRVGFWLRSMGIGIPYNAPYWWPTERMFLEDESHSKPSWTLRAKLFTTRIFEALDQTLFFRGWFYVVLIGLWVFLGYRWGTRQPLAFSTMAASAVLLQVGLFFLSPSAEFRYSLWMLPVTWLLPVLLKWPRRASKS